MKTYDLIILGAGPSGSTLLRFCQNKNLNIAIVDKRNLDEDSKYAKKIKSCGGMINDDAQKFLKEHNIVLPQEILDDIQPKFVRTFDEALSFNRCYKRDYINVNREAFDRFLLEGLNADRYFDYLVSKIEFIDDYYVINDELKTKILVGADGALSKVRTTFFPEMIIDKYVSIQDVIKPQMTKEYECFFDEKTSDYYGWSIPKKDCTLFGYAIKDNKQAPKLFEIFKEKRGAQGEFTREGTLILRPKFFHKIHCKKNLFLIGEAGGFISPSSAEGFSYAFKTAKILADSDFKQKTFLKKMRKIQINIMYKSIKSLFQNTPFFRKIIMALSFLR